MSPKTAIVIGHGMVGHRFVEAMRARDEAGQWRITVLCEEPLPAYDRVGLSSYVGTWDHKELALAGNTYDGDEAVELRLGVRADSIDREAKTVTTNTGEVLAYDTVVLATGSYPFVPPAPGHDLDKCFVYRTLADLDGIRATAEAAGPGATGVVVGGGLLGLEAANALKLMGMEPHVIELAPRLMPIQVDEGGGAVLKKLISDLGVNVHTGVSTAAIKEGPGGLIVELSDGSTIDAALLVWSAGIRPQDKIAREAGLEVGPRGGVITDLSMITSDPAIYAVGEVAAVEGVCYGLVAPGYAQAEVIADRLLGGEAEFPGADLSTKLKLLGVDVASFGDAHAHSENALEVVLMDAAKGTYAKLVVSDDAKTLLGGIFVGDASLYASLRPLVGGPLPADPAALISPAGAELGADAMPDSAVVCTCNNVTKGAICEVIHDGVTDLAEVKKCSKAGTSCGGCLPLVKKILAQSGVEISKSLCEHFTQSRAELFEIIQVTGIRTFSELIAQHGTGTGCDLCKPTAASIFASLKDTKQSVLDGEQASLQDTNDHFLANLQKNGTYSVVPRMPGGEVTAEQLIVIGQIAKDFDLYVKVTGGQRIDLFGARVEELPLIWKRLIDAGMESGHAYGKSLRTVKSCVGQTWCRYGVQDSVGMAVLLENRYKGLRSPHKLKLAVSGCARECAEARGKDVGVIATERGWGLYVGGNGGQSPKHAELLATDLDDETLIKYIDRYLMFYIRTADRLQRTAPWQESVGLDHIKEVVIDDSLGIAGDLDKAMAIHVDSYTDEWADVVNDPDKLARFVSFVNAPTEHDPTVGFDASGPRKVPVLLGMPEIQPAGWGQ
ncbi:MAG: nitrite reductase large subunit NirB [Nocardiaceae bacterium]|nr:nitrite reductase large subunit NirB [Nocardiaceae bacterium]